jgi:hypothetical protein
MGSNRMEDRIIVCKKRHPFFTPPALRKWIFSDTHATANSETQDLRTCMLLNIGVQTEIEGHT